MSWLWIALSRHRCFRPDDRENLKILTVFWCLRRPGKTGTANGYRIVPKGAPTAALAGLDRSFVRHVFFETQVLSAPMVIIAKRE
jgi:hypothetical protein